MGMRTATLPTETEICRALVDDLDRGFTTMVRTFQPGVYSGARRLTHHHQDAQEVAQDTFVRAYAALSTYDEDRILDMRLRAWLWTIALNLCRSRAKKRIAVPTDIDPEHVVEYDEEFLDDMAWTELLATLAEPQRNAVVLRHVLDLPISEIAEITDRPEGTVKADISRGLARLRTAIETEDLT